MTKIIFVCFGNICRSPMAEFVMKDLVARAGLEKDFLIKSAGTCPSVGTPMSDGTAYQLEKHHIPFTRRTSKELQPEDYDRYDYLVGMDKANIRGMKDICGGDRDGKIFRLMEFAGENRDVADPWYTERYDVTYEDCIVGCAALLKRITGAEV